MTALDQLSVIGELAPMVKMLPHKYLVDGVTPSADQANRGDCWLFAITGLLEDSYRRWGVKQGWMDGKDFLRLSRQALGIGVMELCNKQPLSICPAMNDGELSIRWGNTTEGSDGADEHLLYWLRSLGDGVNVLPDSVCAYAEVADWRQEWACQGLEESRKKNPLHFEVKSMVSVYEREAVKQSLVKTGRPLSLGLTLAFYPVYPPCLPALGCTPSPETCVPCPLERVYGNIDCCFQSNKPMVSMKGEWFHPPAGEPIIEEGGHAVNIVGYNDNYKTEQGHVGGYIVRNTWADGLGTAHGLKARGSHTARYFLQDVSDGDEGLACPNPHSPRMWTTCQAAKECTTPLAKMEAMTGKGVLTLQCLDTGLVIPKGSCDSASDYYLKGFTEFGSAGMFIACFVTVAKSDGAENSLCLPPLTLDDIATVFTPVAEEMVLNNKLLCGFNFIPYETLEAMQVRFGGVVMTNYDIQWKKESYLKYAREDEFDYSLVKQSTKELLVMNISKPEKYNEKTGYSPLRK